MATKKWKPELGSPYYTVCVDWSGFYVHKTHHSNTDSDLRVMKLNNCFKTKTEANIKLALVKDLFR